MASNCYRLLLAVEEGNIPETLFVKIDGEYPQEVKSFLNESFESGYSFLVESRCDSITYDVKDIAAKLGYPDLLCLTKDEEIIYPTEVQRVVVALSALLTRFEQEQDIVATALGWTVPATYIAEALASTYESLVDTDPDGESVEYLIYFLKECRAVFQAAFDSNRAVVYINFSKD